VGDYKLVSKMVCNCGAVWAARDKHGEPVAIKCIDKQKVFTPGEVEGINREYRFLQGFIRHPNIVKAFDFLHSQTYVYIILEHVGNENLAQHLSNLPGKRLDADASLGIFRQLVSGLAHCHEKNITHRSVSPEHVVLSKNETDESLIPHLVDFHTAMVAKAGVMSRSVCGKLPCIAPEVLSGELYIPISADVWSVGILLLEMAGGLESLVKAVDITPEEADILQMNEEQVQASSNKVRDYFAIAGNHENALAHLNGVHNEEIRTNLKSLLVLPIDRPSLQTLYPAPEEETLETNTNDVLVTDVDVVDGPN